jgi:hypothetical protein
MEFGKFNHTLGFRGQSNSRSRAGAYVNSTHRTEHGNLVSVLKEKESRLRKRPKTVPVWEVGKSKRHLVMRWIRIEIDSL